MRIVHVATGLITIPPNGWGAVERLTWEYKQGLEKLGDVVDIKYMNELEKWPDTIVHAHLANQALYCREKGIPYVYSLHDHHTEWYGKDSWVYKQNLEAMKHSIISFTHAEYLVDYFSETDKLFYLRHGANTEFFTPDYAPKTHALLMIANNGLAGNSGFDRKGFRYGIEAAKEMDLPITMVLPNISTESVMNGIAETIKTYDHRRNEMFEARDSYSWDLVANTLHKYYENVLKINEGYTSERTRQLYINAYDNL